ncbi:MAG: DUF4339 domain-containing protein [Chthoniobacterales bacterium]
MRSYQLKIAEREEGPYTEEQVSQLFADGRVDRYTPCRTVGSGEWKEIDDYLPMLKYGTQLPPATVVVPAPEVPAEARPAASAPSIPTLTKQVTLVDIDLPFFSLVRLMFKWAAAGLVVGICLIPILIILWVVLFALLALFFGSTFSFLHRP